MHARILVVDDNAINQLVAKRILLNAGYAVEGVLGGHEAIRACTTHCYDLVLMDCTMPEMDGKEATRHIRQLQNHQPIIVAVTALSLREARERCLDDLMNGYLGKPYTAAQLLQLVREKLTGLGERCGAA